MRGWVRVIQDYEDGFQNTVDILKNLVVPKTDHLKPFSFEPLRTAIVFLLLGDMLTSIQFNDKFLFRLCLIAPQETSNCF